MNKMRPTIWLRCYFQVLKKERKEKDKKTKKEQKFVRFSFRYLVAYLRRFLLNFELFFFACMWYSFVFYFQSFTKCNAASF